jgi:GNAT superfamily N-acetyltransferase
VNGVQLRRADAGERVSEVAAIYVQPKHWRRGVGTVLLSAASSKLRGQAWNTVTLWVLDANTQAIAFYSVHGFTPDGAKAHDDHTNLPEIRLRALLTE